MTTTTEHPQEHTDPRPAELGKFVRDEEAAEEVEEKLFELWTAALYIWGGTRDLEPFLHSPAGTSGSSWSGKGREALRRLRSHLAAGLTEVRDLGELYTSKRPIQNELFRHEERISLLLSAIHGMLEGEASESMDVSVLAYALGDAIQEARKGVTRRGAGGEEEGV